MHRRRDRFWEDEVIDRCSDADFGKRRGEECERDDCKLGRFASARRAADRDGASERRGEERGRARVVRGGRRRG